MASIEKMQLFSTKFAVFGNVIKTLSVFDISSPSKLKLMRKWRNSIKIYANDYNKHLMTDPKGNSEFCFPETLKTLRSRGNKTYCFPQDMSSSVLLHLPIQN